MARVTIYVVTYRLGHLLERALASVLSQTFLDLKVCVVNDDPADPTVAAIIKRFDDRRVFLFTPQLHRGGSANFNLAFREVASKYTALLEADNWWEPDFLTEMISALDAHPHIDIAIASEQIWKEKLDGSWTATGRTTLPTGKNAMHYYSVFDLCGSAKLCNSAMLVRVPRCHNYLIPETIPIDVTEHFRERALLDPVILVPRPLVNFADRLSTNRSTDGFDWSIYQCLIIGSVFAGIDDREARAKLAEELWAKCAYSTSSRAVSLVQTGVFVEEARALLQKAPLGALARSFLWAVRHPRGTIVMARLKNAHKEEFEYLRDAPLTSQVTSRFAAPTLRRSHKQNRAQNSPKKAGE